jgi:phosphohistidine phosphatase
VDLILWRHAEAEDGLDDHERKLTVKGRKQAVKMAKWLGERLPRNALVLASPARRTQETAAALGQTFETSAAVGLSASTESILQAAGWPRAARAVVVVGHQPTLGATAARLLGAGDAQWALRKGAIVWLTRKGAATVLRAALSPDLL